MAVGGGTGVVEVSACGDGEGDEDGGITIDVCVDEDDVVSPKLERVTVNILASDAVVTGVCASAALVVDAAAVLDALIPNTLSAADVSVQPT